MRRIRATLLLAGVAAAALTAPTPALAHGLVGRSDLPIPDWLFTWGASAVLVVSFVALAALWPTPRLQEERFRELPTLLSRLFGSRTVEVVCGSVGVALLALVVYSGLAGRSSTSDNLVPTFIYVAFWLGLVPISVVFGDVFRAFNPWRAIGRATGAAFNRLGGSRIGEPIGYPSWLGYWPAVLGLLAFAWLELVSYRGDDPAVLAQATLVYTALTLTAMTFFGVERWCERGEAFSVYFGLFARMSPLTSRDGRLGLRRPLTGLTTWRTHPGCVALVATMIGITSFDGLSAGKPYNDFIKGPFEFFAEDLQLGAPRALEVTFALTALVVIMLIAGLFWLGMAGARTVDRSKTTTELAHTFVHTLVPIALAYVVAHYVSLLLLQGQALPALFADPLGDGGDLIGTANWGIDYGFIGAETFWYIQVGAVVLGHVLALTLAHDRALAIYDNARAAVRSQYWLLTVMVGFTTLALWLLAQAREG